MRTHESPYSPHDDARWPVTWRHGSSTASILLPLFAVTLIGIATPAPATADGRSDSSSTDLEWINATGGMFGAPMNWSPAIVPGPDDTAWFSLDAAYTVTSLNPIITAGARLRSGNVTFDLSGNLWQLAQSGQPVLIGIEAGDAAELRISSGHLALHEVHLGSQAGAFGSLTIDGPDSHLSNSWGSHFAIGEHGTGVASVVNGGSAEMGLHARIGYQQNSDGTLHVEGAGSEWISNGNIFAGTAGNGHINVINGGFIHAQNLLLSSTAVSYGSMHLTDPGSQAQAIFFISVGHGFNAAGDLLISNGATAASHWGIIGELNGSIGDVLVTGDGSAWNADSTFQVGSRGSGMLRIEDGAMIQSNRARISWHSGSTGHVILQDAGSMWNNNTVFEIGVNDGTNARLDLRDGAAIASDSLIIGPWGIVHADGTIEADITNSGTLAPTRIGEDDAYSPGSLHINGDYTHEPGGALHVRVYGIALSNTDDHEITGATTLDEWMEHLANDPIDLDHPGGFDEYEFTGDELANLCHCELIADAISVAGTAFLGGELIIELQELIQLPPEFCLTIIEADEVIGDFADITIVGPDLAPLNLGGLVPNLHIDQHAVTLCAEPPAGCPADLNQDGVVDGADLLMLLEQWGPCDNPDACSADIAGNDDVVDSNDALILLSMWGPCPE